MPVCRMMSACGQSARCIESGQVNSDVVFFQSWMCGWSRKKGIKKKKKKERKEKIGFNECGRKKGFIHSYATVVRYYYFWEWRRWPRTENLKEESLRESDAAFWPFRLGVKTNLSKHEIWLLLFDRRWSQGLLEGWMPVHLRWPPSKGWVIQFWPTSGWNESGMPTRYQINFLRAYDIN